MITEESKKAKPQIKRKKVRYDINHMNKVVATNAGKPFRLKNGSKKYGYNIC